MEWVGIDDLSNRAFSIAQVPVTDECIFGKDMGENIFFTTWTAY